MKGVLLLSAALVASIGSSEGADAAATTAGAPVAVAELKPGDVAPPFAMKGSDGKVHTLADHAGKRAVVVAWFPKAFTGG